MRCTEKEQETCEFEKRGCEGCIYNEKSADEMFAELGFRIINDNAVFYELINKDDKVIEFDLQDKTISCYFYYDDGFFEDITMQELQAINKKCKEMGWMD